MGRWQIGQNETLPGGERGGVIRAEGGSQAVWPGFPAPLPIGRVVWANQFPCRAGVSHSGCEAWFGACSKFRLWGHCRSARYCSVLGGVFAFCFE